MVLQSHVRSHDQEREKEGIKAKEAVAHATAPFLHHPPQQQIIRQDEGAEQQGIGQCLLH